MADFDVVVLGAGPGGYVAAIRAASSARRLQSWRRSTGAASASTSAASPARHSCATRRSPHHHAREEDLRDRGRRDDVLRHDPFAQPRRRRQRQGRALPDEEEQDRGGRRLGHDHRRDLHGRRSQRRLLAHHHLRQPHHRHRCHGANAPRHAGEPERRHLRGADPRREPPELDHHRWLRRHRRRVRLRAHQFRCRRDDRRVPRPDGADRGRGRLQELFKQYKKLGVKVMLSTAVQNVEDTGSGVRVHRDASRWR